MTTSNYVFELLTSNKFSDPKYIEFLNLILSEESNFIMRRKNMMNIKLASFLSIKKIEEFDFSFQPNLNQNKILELATLDFIQKKQNIIFVGNFGVGKVHLSISIGIKAIEGKRSTYFIH